MTRLSQMASSCTERLFSQLVCLQLLARMDSYREDFGRDGFDEFYTDDFKVDQRLHKLEVGQSKLNTMLEYIVARLDAVLPAASVPVPTHAPSFGPGFGHAPAAAMLARPAASDPVLTHAGLAPAPVHPGYAPSLDPSSPIVSPLSPVSPLNYAFVCPLCTTPQFTPKAHCEHMRKVGLGTGNCSFKSSVDLHLDIMRVFRTPAVFTKWSVFLMPDA